MIFNMPQGKARQGKPIPIIRTLLPQSINFIDPIMATIALFYIDIMYTPYLHDNVRQESRLCYLLNLGIPRLPLNTNLNEQDVYQVLTKSRLGQWSERDFYPGACADNALLFQLITKMDNSYAYRYALQVECEQQNATHVPVALKAGHKRIDSQQVYKGNNLDIVVENFKVRFDFVLCSSDFICSLSYAMACRLNMIARLNTNEW